MDDMSDVAVGNRLLKKFRDSGQTSVQRQSTKCPHDMVLSQEDQPRTHSIVRKISRKTGNPK